MPILKKNQAIQKYLCDRKKLLHEEAIRLAEYFFENEIIPAMRSGYTKITIRINYVMTHFAITEKELNSLAKIISSIFIEKDYNVEIVDLKMLTYVELAISWE